MTRAQIAVRLAQGKWVKLWDAAKLFHIDPIELLPILESIYIESVDGSGDRVDKTWVRIIQIPRHCSSCEYDYNDCMIAQRCFLEERYGTGKERKD
jgi:hypothetical protein